MSDFTSSFWGVWIAAISIGGVIYLLWLLLNNRVSKVPLNADGTVEDTGHVWDENLRELNTPMPRWWVWMYLLGCVFGIGYMVLYPASGIYEGMLGWTTQKAQQAEVDAANAELKPMYDQYMAMDIKQVAADTKARQIGQRLFLANCAQCHGSDAGGGKGFPNLSDADWLYGGEPDAIKTTITGGRQGAMPAHGGTLTPEQIKDVANYVRSLSSMEHDAKAAERGKETFSTICAACHGPDGKGTQALGAPNLTDNIWLYGASEETIIETITNGRAGKMPAWGEVLTPEKIHMLSAYVWSLSNTSGEAAQ